MRSAMFAVALAAACVPDAEPDAEDPWVRPTWEGDGLPEGEEGPHQDNRDDLPPLPDTGMQTDPGGGEPAPTFIVTDALFFRYDENNAAITLFVEPQRCADVAGGLLFPDSLTFSLMRSAPVDTGGAAWTDLDTGGTGGSQLPPPLGFPGGMGGFPGGMGGFPGGGSGDEEVPDPPWDPATWLGRYDDCSTGAYPCSSLYWMVGGEFGISEGSIEITAIDDHYVEAVWASPSSTRETPLRFYNCGDLNDWATTVF